MSGWRVVVSGGERDGEIVRLQALGRMLVADLHLHLDGHVTQAEYDYTGLCPRQRVAFARYARRTTWP